MSSVNPLTFYDPASISTYGNVGQNGATQPTDLDVKRAFLQLLLEKVYLKDFSIAGTGIANNLSEDQGDVSIFNTDMANTVVNDLMRQQLATQMIDNNAFDLGNVEGKP